MGIDIRTFDSIEPGETVAVVEGDLDAATGRVVRNRLVKLMAGEPKSFALDLSNVHLVDSGGLAAMIGLLRAVRDVGGDVRVIAANDSVRRVFEVTALSRVFKYHPIRPQVVSAA
jgi:anti-sigma B factor antagonist